MAKIAEEKKIREYTDLEIEQANSNLIQGLKAMLGVSLSDDEDRMMQTLAVDQYITRNLSSFTYSEIREAFFMAISGDFDGMKEWGNYKVFPKLDCVLVGKVMSAFKAYKQQRLKQYNDRIRRERAKLQQPTITKEEETKIAVRLLTQLNKEYIENGNIGFGNSYLYDFLDKQNLMPTDKEYKKQVWRRAQKLKINKPSDAVSALASIEANKNKTKTEKQSELRTISKMIALEDFFKKINKENKKIEDLIWRK